MMSEQNVIASPPSMIAVEITKLCDMKCVMCVSHSETLYQGQADNQPNFMSVEFFESIVRQYAEAQPDRNKRSITPQFQGESLVNPKFLEYCDVLEKYEVSFGFTTNGSRLTDDIIEKLLGYNWFSNICFSADGSDKETYESIRIKGKYDRVVRNITSFLEKLSISSKNVKTSLSFTEQPLNLHDTNNFIRNWVASVDAININHVAINGRPPKRRWTPERFACGDLWDFMVILTDGSVVPCCRDYLYTMKMGNVNEKGLMDVWNGGAYQNLRKAHIDGRYNDYELCSDCDTWMCRDQRRDVETLGDAVVVSKGPFFEAANLKSELYDGVIIFADNQSVPEQLLCSALDIFKRAARVIVFSDGFSDFQHKYRVKHHNVEIVSSCDSLDWVSKNIAQINQYNFENCLLISLNLSFDRTYRSFLRGTRLLLLENSEVLGPDTGSSEYERKLHALNSSDVVGAMNQETLDSVSALVGSHASLINLVDYCDTVLPNTGDKKEIPMVQPCL